MLYSGLVNHRTPVALLLGAFLLAGCQSKTPAPESSPKPAASEAPASDMQAAPNPSPAVAPDGRPVIVAFGDSLTAGYGADPGQSYPDYLQNDLEAKGYHYQVINQGISGNTTKDGVDRLQDVLQLKPVLVIVAFGGNDGLRGLPIASTRENLDRIVSTLLHSGAKVVLGGITLPPNYGPDYIHQFNQTYALLAAKYHVPMLPFLLKNVWGVPGDMQADGIHATDQGNAQVAKNLLPLIVPQLKK
ncbi:MAG TPA: arylesterase [Acidobacteriaceae bacterium]|nr:arylesterase [Acidobacteriaceae bacterium]